MCDIQVDTSVVYFTYIGCRQFISQDGWHIRTFAQDVVCLFIEPVCFQIKFSVKERSIYTDIEHFRSFPSDIGVRETGFSVSRGYFRILTAKYGITAGTISGHILELTDVVCSGASP